MLILSLVLTFVAVLAVSILIGKWLYKEDEELVARRKEAAQMAGICTKYGLTVAPELLIDYSAGAYADLLKTFVQFMRATLKDEAALVAELNSVFAAMLDKQIATPAGLALVKAKIAAVPA